MRARHTILKEGRPMCCLADGSPHSLSSNFLIVLKNENNVKNAKEYQSFEQEREGRGVDRQGPC